MLVQALLFGAAGLAGWEWLKARGAARAATPTGRAAVPPSQAAPEGVAPSIPGHVIPTPPAFTRQQIEAAWKTNKAGEGRVWWNVLAGVPWPDATGLWRSKGGALYQFRDCGGNPIGQPGYMPLQYQAWLAAGVNCDGKPFPPQSVPGNMAPIVATAQPGAYAPNSAQAIAAHMQAEAASWAAPAGAGPSAGQVAGQVAQVATTAIGTASTIATAVGAATGAGTAATVAAAGAAVASGAGSAAAGVAAGIGAALACLGPIPAFLMPTRISGYAVDHGVRHATWIESRTLTLLVDEGDRTLGVNVARVWDDRDRRVRFTVAAIEVPASEKLRYVGVAGAIAAMYDDHAHTIVGVFDEYESATHAAELYASDWQNQKPTLMPCSCSSAPPTDRVHAVEEEPLS